MRRVSALYIGLCILLCAAFLAPTSAKADDLGLTRLARTINASIGNGRMLFPFRELPSEPMLLSDYPNGVGILGSIVKLPANGSQFYSIEDDMVCNPTDYAFPRGQGGPQRIVSSNRFDFDLAAGEITVRGGSKNDTVFSLSPITAQILRRVSVTLTDIREYTLDLRNLYKRVLQVSSDPLCANHNYAITKVYIAKAKVTYFFKASLSLTAKLDVATAISAKLGLSIATQDGTSEADPNTLSFESAERIFAARIRPVSEILPGRKRGMTVAAKP